MQLLGKKEKRKDGGKLFVHCYEKISRKNCNVEKKKRWQIGYTERHYLCKMREIYLYLPMTIRKNCRESAINT